ncbi:DUF3185 family protein [Synoicihabitans lomoniglobus]|uniref:DUF3185 family protein n=1 Tax=Synoicihabitans lomoniglobus TaxID=2909285 RepID=A0AAE9ZXF4_9BACT|nr:DUF3185 family protein [Opitutaceae bacterium LMO-M01]WED64690.1 DUF3185 family protein [Opitutaceae bacterium LMO-M01]
MNKITSIVILIIGIGLLVYGIEASDSVGSAVSEVVNDAPSNKSIVLVVAGLLATVAGGVGLIKRR